jgi:hypothetical protein
MCLPDRPAVRAIAILAAVAAVTWIIPALVFPSGSDSVVGGTPYYPPDHPLSAPALAARNVAAAREALGLLANSSWDAFEGADGAAAKHVANLTGFRSGDGYAWEDLGTFRERCGEVREGVFSAARHDDDDDDDDDDDNKNNDDEDPVWRNISGIVHGNWVRRAGGAHRERDSYNLSAVAPWLDWSQAGEWARNVTGGEGVMSVLLHSKDVIVDWDDARREREKEGHEGHDHKDKDKDGDGDEHHKTPTDRDRTLPPRASLVRGIRADVTVEDVDGGGIWDMRLHGVHFPREGTLYLTTSSEKFDGILGLPFLTPSQDYYLPSRELLSAAVADKLDGPNMDASFANGAIPWSSDLESGGAGTTTPAASCEFVLFAQIHPPRMPSRRGWFGRWLPVSGSIIDRIAGMEAELEEPLGLNLGPVPPLELSAVLWSPDCAFSLETPAVAAPLAGVKSQVQRWRIDSWILALAAMTYVQVRLLQLQIREANTPSTMGRISFATLAIMVVVDGTVFVIAATWSLSAGYTLLPSLTLVFASFVALVVGGGFLARVHEAQMPSRRRDNSSNNTTTTTATTAAAAAPLTTNSPPNDTDPLLPTTEPPPPPPTTNDTPTTPPPPPADAPPRSFQSLVRLFFLGSIVLSLFALASTSWRPATRGLYLNTLLILYASLWLPQILRNITRNSRRSLAWRFVLGQSVLRFAPLAYFWCWEGNFVFARTDHVAFAAAAAWLWLQMSILAVQDILGPRFAIPESWTPPAWDYHLVLREDALESGTLPVGILSSGPPSPARSRTTLRSSNASSSSSSRSSSSSPPPPPRTTPRPRRSNVRIRAVDCAICTDRVEVAVVRAGEEDDSGVAGVLARRTYMATPCRHIFHSACLEAWMRHKLQCPICREDLPPL